MFFNIQGEFIKKLENICKYQEISLTLQSSILTDNYEK